MEALTGKHGLEKEFKDADTKFDDSLMIFPYFEMYRLLGVRVLKQNF